MVFSYRALYKMLLYKGWAFYFSYKIIPEINSGIIPHHNYHAGNGVS